MEQAAPAAGRCVHLFAFERSPVERSYKMILAQAARGGNPETIAFPMAFRPSGDWAFPHAR
jgi:hypothetical protein